MDVGVEPDRNPIDAEGANGLVQIDLTLLDLKSLRFELVGDVG